MPPPNASSKVRLGVFVVSGLVLGVMALLSFGMGRLFERSTPLHCYFTESVQGLEEMRAGAKVHLAEQQDMAARLYRRWLLG